MNLISQCARTRRLCTVRKDFLFIVFSLLSQLSIEYNWTFEHQGIILQTLQHSAYRFIAKCNKTYMEYDIFVWNAVLVINLHWVLLFYFCLLWSIELCALQLTTVIMQAPHAVIVCKCDDILIDWKSFWTLDFNWETFMQPTWAKCLGQRRKELFPVSLNNSCP